MVLLLLATTINSTYICSTYYYTSTYILYLIVCSMYIYIASCYIGIVSYCILPVHAAYYLHS